MTNAKRSHLAAGDVHEERTWAQIVVSYLASVTGVILAALLTVYAVANHYTSLTAALLRQNFDRFSLPDDSFLGPLWAALGMNVTLAQSTAALLAVVNAAVLFTCIHLIAVLVRDMPDAVWSEGLSWSAAACRHRVKFYFLGVICVLTLAAVNWDVGLQTYLWLTNYFQLAEVPLGEIAMKVPRLDLVRRDQRDLFVIDQLRAAQVGYIGVLFIVAILLEVALYFAGENWKALTAPARLAARAAAEAISDTGRGVRDLLRRRPVVGSNEEASPARAMVTTDLHYDADTDRVWDRRFLERLRNAPRPSPRKAIKASLQTLALYGGLEGGYFAPPTAAAATTETEVIVVQDFTGTYAPMRGRAQMMVLDFLERLGATADRKLDPRENKDRSPHVTIIALDAFSEVVFDGRAAELKAKERQYFERLFAGRASYSGCSDVLRAFQLVQHRLEAADACSTKVVLAFTDLRHEPLAAASQTKCEPPKAPLERFPFDALRSAYTQVFFVPRADVAIWKPAIDERGLGDSFRLFADAGPDGAIPLPPKPRPCAPDVRSVLGAAANFLPYMAGAGLVIAGGLWLAARPSSAPPPRLNPRRRPGRR